MFPRHVILALLLVGCEEKPKEPPPAEKSAPPPVTASAPATASASTAPPDSIAAQHVLVTWKGSAGAPKSVTRTKDEAKKRADEVAAKAKAGEDFSSLVTTYSDDEGTKGRQGSLGKFDRSKMVKPFADAAFALPVNGTSDPVETAYGYHVIKRNQ